MHRLLVAGALALALPLGPTARAGAQARDSLAVEQHDVREAGRRAIDVYNAPATLRARGSLEIDSSRTITGDVAIFDGTLVVAGHVTGRVAAINADVELRPGARVDGEIVVVGGRLAGRDGATVGGPVTAFRQSVVVRDDGDRLALEAVPLVDRWWERWRTRHTRDRSTVRLSSGGTYNRVEGLPVHFGPVLRQRTAWGRINAEAEGIYRSARDFRWDSRNIGHDARLEVLVGDTARGLGLGGRLYDVVTPVEDWQVGDAENGFAAFILHRDLRDHFDRHGSAAWVRALAGPGLELRLSLADERWGSRGDRDPWALFRDDVAWRANPELDEGQFHIATAMVHFDTRNDEDRPLAGWYAHGEVERGTGTITRLGPSSDPQPRVDVLGDGRITWTRAFVDVRKYSRLAPNTQLNLRMLLGGAVDGDPLPLNRRLSLGGVGSLPGYDFRRDALPSTTCSGFTDITIGDMIVDGVARGRPAECERIALAQVEYRTDFNIGLDLLRQPGRYLRIRRVGQWVIFANSGRGWLVGPRIGEVQYRAGQLPTFSTFRTDIGAGVDFGRLGFYVAKSVSDGDERPNFLVRLRRRF